MYGNKLVTLIFIGCKLPILVGHYNLFAPFIPLPLGRINFVVPLRLFGMEQSGPLQPSTSTVPSLFADRPTIALSVLESLWDTSLSYQYSQKHCIGASINAELDCPCGLPGIRCHDVLSVCNLERKCVCDSKKGFFSADRSRCIAYSSSSITTKLRTSVPTTTQKTSTAAQANPTTTQTSLVTTTVLTTTVSTTATTTPTTTTTTTPTTTTTSTPTTTTTTPGCTPRPSPPTMPCPRLLGAPASVPPGPAIPFCPGSTVNLDRGETKEFYVDSSMLAAGGTCDITLTKGPTVGSSYVSVYSFEVIGTDAACLTGDALLGLNGPTGPEIYCNQNCPDTAQFVSFPFPSMITYRRVAVIPSYCEPVFDLVRITIRALG